ncbi:MAG: TonB-dependent receptor [Bacteroidaceae bacterium]|nr:TonB-dependent receptor [Bacteroidaceae bacterium]
MKKKMKAMAMLMAFCSMGNAANSSPDIKGLVVDEEGQPMPYVNVVLLEPSDSSFIEGVITDQEGFFQIDGQNKNGLLRISSVGYQTQFLSDPDNNQLLTVRLASESQVLNAVEITAMRPKTVVTTQGMETSVQGTILESQGTANDVLARIPGLIKTGDDLQVIGRGNPVIYINGRMLQDKSELDRLQSTEIKSVEVINNPGAQYDATVTAVVRIRTVRHQGDGFGFTFSAGNDQDVVWGNSDPNANLDVNFRHNGLDFFAGAGYAHNSVEQHSDIHQTTVSTVEFVQDGKLGNSYSQDALAYNAGVNWQISDYHSVGVRYDISQMLGGRNKEFIDEDVLLDGTLQEHILSDTEHEINAPLQHAVNTYYNGTVGKLGIDLNVDYFKSGTESVSKTIETGQLTNTNVDTKTTTDNNLVASKLVLSYPIWMGRLQGGAETYYVDRKNTYNITGAPVANADSKTTEKMLAGFAEYAFQLPSVGVFSAGIRYEHTDMEYRDRLDPTQDMSRSTDDFFPTLVYSNVFGPVQMSLSYSAKTVRPDFQQLCEAISYNNRYTLQRGNAQLKNEIQHHVALNARYSVVTFSSEFVQRNNAISQWSYLYGTDGAVLIDYVNLAKPVRSLTTFVNVMPSFGSYTLNATAAMVKPWLTLDLEDPRVAGGIRTANFTKPIYILQLFNTLSLPKSWSAELSTVYQSKGDSQNMSLMSDQFILGAAVQKSFLKNDALTLRLSYDDILHDAKSHVLMDCGYYQINQYNRMMTSLVKATLRYRFNTAQSKYRGTGAGQEVKDRF